MGRLDRDRQGLPGGPMSIVSLAHIWVSALATFRCKRDKGRGGGGLGERGMGGI